MRTTDDRSDKEKDNLILIYLRLLSHKQLALYLLHKEFFKLDTLEGFGFFFLFVKNVK